MKPAALLLTLGHLLIGPTAPAQKPTKPYTIELTFTQVTNIPDRRFFIDSIADGRPASDTSGIGVVVRGMGRQVPAVLKGGFLPALQNHLYGTYMNLDGRFQPLILSIEEFELNETQTSWGNRTRFELVASFYARDSARTYPLLYHAELISESGGETHADRIKSALKKAFTKLNEHLIDPTGTPAQYNDFDLEAAKAAKELDLTEVTYPAERTADDDIITATQKRPGIYRNFEELRQNRPSLTGTLYVPDAKADFTILRKPTGTKAKYRFFGFSDGTNVFVSTGSYSSVRFQYTKVKSLGTRYWLWIDNYTTANEAAARAASLGFGLIGALAANAATTRDCLALDLQTGKIGPMLPETIVQILADEPELLAEYKGIANQKNFRQQFDILHKFNQRRAAK